MDALSWLGAQFADPSWLFVALPIAVVLGWVFWVNAEDYPFLLSSSIAVPSATLMVWEPFGWGPWRMVLVLPAIAVVQMCGMVLVQGVEGVCSYVRIRRGRPNRGDAHHVIGKSFTGAWANRRAVEVKILCDWTSSQGPLRDVSAMARAGWRGANTWVTYRTVVRWLRSGEQPDRLWCALVVGLNETDLCAYLDGTVDIDWGAVEAMAARCERPVRRPMT